MAATSKVQEAAATMQRIEAVEAEAKASMLSQTPVAGKLAVIVRSDGTTMRTRLDHAQILHRKMTEAKEGKNPSARRNLGKLQIGGSEKMPLFLEDVVFHASDKPKDK